MSASSSLVHDVHRRLLDEPGGDLTAAAERHVLALAPLLPSNERRRVVGAAVAHARGLGPLDPLLADPTVTEILVNGGRQVWVERHGRLEQREDLAEGTAALLIERIIAPLGLRIDRASPIVDARLEDGSRVHAVIPPVAVDGPCLAIRRFATGGVPLAAFGALPVVDLVGALVDERANIVVSGATSSGKTTLLNALLARVPRGERVVTIEDAAELRVATPHVVRLEARPPSVEGVGEVTVRTLVRAALRLRPDRLVIGEVRGAEALDMVMALNTGHDGSLTTCHSNGPEDALRRIEAMVVMGVPAWPAATVRDHVRRSVDVVIHLARGRDGRRVVSEILEVGTDDEHHHRVLARGDVVLAAFERRRWRR